MGTRVNRAMWDERREWLEKFAQSNLSLAQFCRENHLNPVNVRSWRRRLEPMAVRRLSAKKPKRAQPHGEALDSASSTAAFVQWKPAAHSVPIQPSVIQSSSPWVEISMADGMLIRVPGANIAALDRVLAAVNLNRPPMIAQGAKS